MTHPYGALRRFGPFFGVEILAGEVSAGDGWLPWAAQADPTVFADRVRAVAAALAATAPEPVEVPDRVAASITQLGLSARATAVVLAAAVEGLGLPALAGWRWQDRLGGPFPLALPAPTVAAVDASWPEPPLAVVRPLVPVVAAHGVSAVIAWGNVASGLAGAVRMITAADPAAGSRAHDLARAALDAPELQGSGDLAPSGAFRRRSCCLIYRLAEPPAYCGDCVLAS